MTNLKIFLFIFLNFIVTYAEISDFRKCANKDCSEPISLAKTILRYAGDDSRILSFPPNAEVKIFSYAAGSRLDLYGAEINGKRGYIPINMVRETRILRPNPTFLVPTEGKDDPKLKSAPTISTENPSSELVLEATPSPVKALVQDQISPNAVTPPYEVIDGTTIYLSPGDNSSPDYSSTPSSVDSSQLQKQENSLEKKVQTDTITPELKSVNDTLNFQEESEKKKVESVEENIKEVKVEENIINKEVKVEENIINKEVKVEENIIRKEAKIDENQINKEENLEGKKLDDSTDSGIFDKISKYIFEDENDNDEDGSTGDEDGSSGDEDGNEEDDEEEEEATTEEKPSTEIPGSTEKNESEAKNLPAVDSSNSDIKEINENNLSSVISSPEPVQEVLDHLNVTKSAEAEPAQVEPVTEPQTETQSVVESKLEQLNKTKEEDLLIKKEDLKIKEEDLLIKKEDLKIKEEDLLIKKEDLKIKEDLQIKVEEKQQTGEETNVNINGVPSVLSNSLNLFHQSVKAEDVPKNDASHTQVPENLFPSVDNETNSSSLPVAEQIIPTTQVSVDEYNLSVDDFKESFTENPVDENHIQSDSSTEKNEDVPEISSEQSEMKTDEINEKIEIKPESAEVEKVEEIIENSVEFSEGKIEEEIKYDKIEDPTFIDAVGAKYNSLVAEEITQNIDNNVDQNIENVSDSFEEVPVTEELTSAETTEQSAVNEEVTEKFEENEEPGIFSKVYNSVFGSKAEVVAPTEETVSELKNSEIIEEATEKPTEQRNSVYEHMWGSHHEEKPVEKYFSPQNNPEVSNHQPDMQSCASSDNPTLCEIQNQNEFIKNENIANVDELSSPFDVPENTYNIFLYLSLTAVTVLLFSLGFYYIEKKRKDSTLIANINNLEKKLLISTKECLLFQDELKTTKERLVSIEDSSFGSNEMVTALKEELEDSKNARLELEEQITNLEKELENVTETGMELNRMLSDMLTSQTGNVYMMQNVEQLQKQLNEQQETINTMKVTLGAKNTENELLQTELSVTNEKNIQLQEELDKMVVNLLSVQEEKNNIENKLEEQNEKLKSEYETTITQINIELKGLKEDNNKFKQQIDGTQRILDLKNNEYDLLKQGMKELQATQSNKDSIMALLDVSKVKAEVQQLRKEKHKIAEKMQKEIDDKSVFEKEVQVMIQEVQILKDKFDEAEKEKVEAQTRLEVLSAYFKEKETQLQKEINEHESKFMQKEGEATSTIERIKWIQEELQNYKAQNELLKKEILDQEVSLKSQISMLEKKSHDNWVLARQAERRLEESKQDASQLRNRLTIVEKNLNNSTHMGDDSKMCNRIMSPLESNGEVSVSPLHMSQRDPPASPPLLFPHRDHMTTSPPIPGLPPFMPPPPGVPFGMPPPMPGVPPFMPPPPALFPGDHRPPPLGRMSSPPLHGRYSPDSRAYSPYDRDDSPPLSPSYPDSDYRRRSPPPASHMPRNYSPYSGKPNRHWERDEDRDYRGGPPRNKPRTHKGLSSGSGNSNESLDNSGRHSGRV